MDDEKIFVTQPTMPEFKKYCKKIKTIWVNHWMTNNGPLHDEFENKLKKFLNTENITLFTNGHTALENAIKVLDLKGEIITTPFTFISTTHAIVRNGLTPVFCDINTEDFTIDTSKIEDLITNKTTAILPVHVYGNVCNIEEIEKIAKKHNLRVIYDAAHAFGIKYKNESISNYGDISMFSFHATKVFNSIEGGALIYKDKNLSLPLNYLKNFGIKDEEHIEYIGGNAKMNEFQAAMGICNLEDININIEKRKKVYMKYYELLKDVKGIRLNKINKNVISNYAYFPILIEEDYKLTRDELHILLKQNNIITRKYFYPICNEFDIYKRFNGNTPIAKDISERILTLPLYSDLKIKDVEKICRIIKEKK